MKFHKINKKKETNKCYEKYEYYFENLCSNK